MVLAALLSAVHVLTLGVGLGAVFVRGLRRPIVTFSSWRRARAAGRAPWTSADAPLGALIRANDLEVALTVLIPFAAALMARGAWLF